MADPTSRARISMSASACASAADMESENPSDGRSVAAAAAAAPKSDVVGSIMADSVVNGRLKRTLSTNHMRETCTSALTLRSIRRSAVAVKARACFHDVSLTVPDVSKSSRAAVHASFGLCAAYVTMAAHSRSLSVIPPL